MQLPVVVRLAESVPHARILDVGVGMGAYGFLLRQYVEVSKERVERSSWQSRIEGIEIFEGYRNPVWDYAYDRVHMGDAMQLVDTLGRFDVILCCDVLEHFEHADARRMIVRCLEHGRALIATTPAGEWEQGAWGGNEAERHRSVVTARDFPGLAGSIQTGATICFAASNDPATRKLLADTLHAIPRYETGIVETILTKLKRRMRRFGVEA